MPRRGSSIFNKLDFQAEPAEDYIFDYENQSYLQPGPERIRFSRLQAKPGSVLSYLYDDARTLYENIRRGLRESNDGNCVGSRFGSRCPDEPYEWLTYSQVITRAVNFGRGLRHLGVEEKEYVGIYSGNCETWVICEQGLYCFSMAIIPLYDTLGPSVCNFIIEQSELSTVVCRTDEKVNNLLRNAPTCLKRLICMEAISEETLEKAKVTGIAVHGFDQVEEIGAAESEEKYPEKPPKPQDVCTISYTSGTTSDPKGAILTHGNMMASISGMMVQLGAHRPKTVDVAISFLPLAHLYERVNQGVMFMAGGSIGFFRGDVMKLIEDVKILQPTLFPLVPRLLSRLYDKIMNSANKSMWKRTLLRMAVNSKRGEVERGVVRRNSMWDNFVFQPIQDALGGKIRMLISGAAPIKPEVLTFFRCALGCHVIEAYGQTEAVAPVCSTLPGDLQNTDSGNVGPPIPSACVKLRDVSEMGYFSTEDQGEICIKGPIVFQGYFKNPEETANVFDEEGWLLTGDIGCFLPNGCLKIIDRRKNIFKLSQGEYIAPERIEAIYSQSLCVAQIFIHGDSLKSSLVGVVVPDWEYFHKQQVRQSQTDSSVHVDETMQEICGHPEITNTILKDLQDRGKEAGLKSFEQVKAIYLHPEFFSVENNLLTPTMKAKRLELKKYFKKELDQLYAELGE